MLRAKGLDVRVGGNIGRPALDLIDDQIPDVFVLELSSFQLETTSSLRPCSAAILNLSADHMDRYDDFGSYVKAKKRILTNAETAVINVDDSNLAQLNLRDGVRKISFSLSCPASDQEYGIQSDGSHEWIMRGRQKIVRTDLLSMNGRHNILNALAAIGLVEGSGHSVSDQMIKALTEFRGLPHRCEQVLCKDGITWINDSKGTNPGAAIAALTGMGRPVVLISGGQSKGADFTQFADAVQRYTRQVLLVGEDRLWIAEAIGNRVPVTLADDLNHAIRLASRWAQPGDAVLFSPACASFDMFKDFEHRGDVYRQLVQELIT
jgi:UDP-N-acetylmuramoylalanine--D-glutamate ligase